LTSQQSQLYLLVFYCVLNCDVFGLLSKAIVRHI